MHHLVNWHYYGYGYSYKITYMLDEQPPNTPGTPQIKSLELGTVKGDTFYTNSPLTIEWDKVDDRPSYFYGYSILSGIKGYIIECSDISNASGINEMATANNTSKSITLPYQGLHYLRLRARDIANNISLPGPEIKVMYDITPPTTPGLPSIPGGIASSEEITWTWSPSNDDAIGSGLKGYEVYVATSDGSNIIANWIFTSTNSFSHSVEDGKTYVCKVVAFDNALNKTDEASAPTGTVIIDNSAPIVKLDDIRYPVRQNGSKVVISWPEVTEDYSGIKKYQVALTTSSDDPDTSTIIYDVSNSIFEKELTISSSNNTYYAWVRAIDNLNNEGEWSSTGPFPVYQIIQPMNYLVSKELIQQFKIEQRYPIQGDELRFKVCYQKDGGSSEESGELQKGAVAVEFPGEGVYQWWLEIAEYTGGVIEPGSKQITEKFDLSIDTTAPEGTFDVKSLDGSKDYTLIPTNTRNVIITDIKLNDNSGQVHSGVKRIYIWNSDAKDPITNIPPTGGSCYSLAEIEDLSETGLSWFLPEVDGEYRINMVIEDNAGNYNNLENMPYKEVTMDRIAPEKPVNFAHTQNSGSINFTWEAAPASDDLHLYRGVYQLPGGMPIDFEIIPSETKTGVQTVNITGVNPNQPVTIKVRAVDQAGNESEETVHTAYSPASTGVLQFLEGGYSTQNEGHFMKWRVIDSIAKDTYLEYGTILAEQLVVLGSISANNGEFIHDALPEGEKLQPHGVYSYRLVAVNESGDKTYCKVETIEVPNQVPSTPELIAPLQFARDTVEFNFSQSIDHDGDLLTYTIYFAEGANPANFISLPGFTKDGLVHGKTYSWYAKVDDGHNGIKTSSSTHFTVDTEQPILNVSEARQPYTNQTQLTISTSDGLSGIDKVTYIKYEANQIVAEGSINLLPDLNGVYNGVIPLTEGSYHLHLTAWDKVGNSRQLERNNLTVDHTAPEFNGLTLKLAQANGIYLSGSSQAPIAWHGTDMGSGVCNLIYWMVESPANQLGTGKILPLSSGLSDYAYNLNLEGTDGKEYFLALALEDKAGNYSEVQYLGPILIDTTAPQGELNLSGLAVYGSNFYLTALNNLNLDLNVSDPESDLSLIQYTIIDNATVKPVSPWTNWDTVKRTTLTEGKSYQVAAKVINGVGLETELQSVNFIYDQTPPRNLTVAGPALSLAQGEQGLFIVNAEENESMIDSYRLAIGSTQGGQELTALVPGNENGWLTIRTGALSAQFRVEMPVVADGTYYPTVEAINAAGLKAIKTGSGFTVSNNQNKVVVSDQGPYTQFGDRLTGWWRYAGLETVTDYRFRILDQDNQIAQDWQTTEETMITITGLNLENGQTYYFEVLANLASGGISASGFSPGIKVDISAPSITQLVMPQYSTSDNLSFNWSGEDNESGISRIEAALGVDFYQTDITGGWVEVSRNQPKLTHDRNGQKLNLVTGQRYYLTLRLINGSELVTEQAAPAVIIDDTPPPAPLVVDQGSYINTQQALEANWIWSPVDPESGTTYEWALLDNDQDLNNVTWNLGPDNFRVRLNDFTQEHGHTYYFAVKATNGAGLASIALSDGIMVDATAPLIPRVVLLQAVDLGDPATAEEVNYLTNTDELGLWIDSIDPDSGTNRYEYTYGNRENVEQAQKETSFKEKIELQGVTFLNGEITLFKGECYNNAELVSQPGYSTGVILDTDAPLIKNVRAGVTGNQLLFDWEVDSSACPVAGYSVVLVTDDQKGSIPTDSAWQNVGLNRSVVIDGTGLADGHYRLLVRGYNRAGTYSRRQGIIDEWGVSPKLTLDRTPPIVKELIYPKYASQQLTVQLAAEDNLSGIHSYQYALGSRTNPVAFSGGWVELERQTGRVEFSIPTEFIQHQSEAYIMARVKDNVGLWSTAQTSERIIIDHTPPEKPEVACKSYTTSQNEILGIAYASNDPESGITHYRMGLVAAPDEDWLVTQMRPINEYDGKLTELQLAEAGTYHIGIQTKNGAGDWSEIGYSDLITVDTVKPELVFTKAGETIVFNQPPINVEYFLNEAAVVKFSVTGADGLNIEETMTGEQGVNQYVFYQVKPQTYTISGIPVDPAGNVGEATDLTEQMIRINAPPVVSLPDQIMTNPGRPIQFKATVSDLDGIDGDTYSYEWFPGDGGPVLDEAVPEYRYDIPGDYTLTLKVTDKDGGWTCLSTTVKVGPTTSGRLYLDEVWSGIHRIYGDVVVPVGIKLTIKSGTQVIVDGVPGESGYYHGIIIRGDLVVEGDGCIFSSSQGGSNAWKGIRIEGNAVLEDAGICNANRGLTVVNNATVNVTSCKFYDNRIGIHIYHANPFIRNSKFQNNNWYGIKEDGECKPVVENCIFSQNEVDYYQDQLTMITMEELNGLPGNEGNKKE
ncbi:MAG: PKD domain-containing protein [Firmicutes bacterium]|nr:PKD domain-containing protein [Bacillota bacterium]